MTAPRRASVVIPVLNGAATIAGTLRSLLTQRDVTVAQIVVVDNGSSDETRAIVAQFPVTLLAEPKRGAAAARNRGLRVVTEDIVAFCDADTILSRRWLAELIAAFDDPAVMLAAGRIVCYPPRTGAERYLATSGIYDAAMASQRPTFPVAPSGNMAVRRAAALALGGFDETMLSAEDADFSHRLLRAYPGTIAYREDALLFHRSRAGDDALRRQAGFYGEGVARLYLRYPELLPWRFQQQYGMVRQVVRRTLYAFATPALRALHVLSSEEAEYARYQSAWDTNYWLGFLRLYYGRRRRGAT